MPESHIEAVLSYHAATKHHLHRFAASLGYLDWATQPDPFRTFEGALKIGLPLVAGTLTEPSYDSLYDPDRVEAAPLNRNNIAALLELSLGLSAWKQYGDTRWALRCNPSSGNLHPTEGYIVAPAIPGLHAGVYHYVSRDHCLELRCVPDPGAAQQLLEAIPHGCLVAGLSSVHWREAWKYGERAFRYCQHDMGHAIGAVRYAAGVLGWGARLLRVSDPDAAAILGLSHTESFSAVDAADREYPGAILLVGPSAIERDVNIASLRQVMDRSPWSGRANRLSSEHVEWPAIQEAADAASCDAVDPDSPQESAPPSPSLPHLKMGTTSHSASTIIRQRRSAVALDDATGITAETFFGMLDRLLPRPNRAPWDSLAWTPLLHCGIFVHRVQGLPQGLYLLERREGVHETLRAALRPDFTFENVDGCPRHIRLFHLSLGDFRHQAQLISCRQKIAGAGAFSLGMIAEFGKTLKDRGAWWYRRLFWEAGLLAHVLYLEAEAAGIRGTGIGCYFDDAFHQLLGLEGPQFQSLYHFTAGGPVEDTRLMTLPPYAHLSR